MKRSSTEVMSRKQYNKPRDCSDFQLYRAAHFAVDERNISDFTEYKLSKLILMSTDPKRKAALSGLLANYKLGRVAVAWQSGSNPIYITVAT